MSKDKNNPESKNGQNLNSKSGDSAEKTGEEINQSQSVQEQAGSAETPNQKTSQDEPSPEEKIAELEAKLAEVNDQYLRKAADFENFRKRMNRDKQDAIEYANQSLLLDLIVTMDDFERALKSAESIATGEFKAFYDGISMIEKRLCMQLENKWGLKRYISAGEPFDPNLHEAIQMEKSVEISEPVVAEEYYKGYTLKERVVRHAKVKVLMPEKGVSANETAKNEESGQSEESGN